MPFTAESIIVTFKTMEVADAPKLKHTQYLNYLARRLSYQSYAHSGNALKPLHQTASAITTPG
ncbi:hypothetical protein ACAW49_08370 [Pseudomonas sp. Env-44]|uniref:hypothetical protein n=1 Tax=unclassified Pseudomonas TaxID=196821 RepID=UPI003522C681